MANSLSSCGRRQLFITHCRILESVALLLRSSWIVIASLLTLFQEQGSSNQAKAAGVDMPVLNMSWGAAACDLCKADENELLSRPQNLYR